MRKGCTLHMKLVREGRRNSGEGYEEEEPYQVEEA